MPKPRPVVLSDALLAQALQRLQEGATTRVLRREFNVDDGKLKRALVQRYGEVYAQIMQARQQARSRAGGTRHRTRTDGSRRC